MVQNGGFMALIVQKYGGSSLKTVENIQYVAQKIIDCKKKGNKVVVVVSAMGKTTDNLINMAKQIHNSPPNKEMDILLSTGEMVSVAMLCIAIENYGEEAEGFPGYCAGIMTDNSHTNARIETIRPLKILEELSKDKIVVVAGFQGISKENAITTLGRGGSDLTAIAVSAALKADLCEIYTDVEGIYTADPNLLPKAKLIPLLCYEELLEMASAGAKVMFSRAVEFAQKYNVPFVVKSTFSKTGEGTMVKEILLNEGVAVSAAALDEKQAKLTIYKVPDRPGISSKIFSALGNANINVDIIVQNVSKEKKSDISFTVNISDAEKANKIIEDVSKEIGAERTECDTDIAKLTIIGIGMMNHAGIAGRMFRALELADINIEMISTSETKISCVIKKDAGKKGLQAVHKEFIED